MNGYPDGKRPDSDRWIEALLGGRLRFHVTAEYSRAAFWERVYKRWSQLYHRTYAS